MISRSQYGSGLLAVPISLYIGLRFWGVAESDLWLDEVFSALTISLGWQEMIYAIVRDGVHPPLFYVLLKLWSIGSHSISWLQLFPFFISVLTLIPFLLLCRELMLTPLETSAALLMIAVNSFLLEYALDLRMYVLMQCLALFSLWLFVRLQKTKDAETLTFLFLTFVNLLLVYTHYFGWLVVGLQGLYLLFWKRRLFYSFAVSSAGIFLCFSLWIWIVLQNAALNGATGDLKWIGSPALSDLVWFYSTLNGNLSFQNTTFINLLIFSIPIGLFIWQMIRQRRNDSNWPILALFAFLPVVFVFVLSVLLPQSVWESRYLMIAAIPYYILLTKSLFALPKRFTRNVFVGLILTWSVVAGFQSFLRTPKRIQWTEVVGKIENSNLSSQKIYTFEIWVAVPLKFYIHNVDLPVQVEQRGGLDEVTERDFGVAYRLPISENSDEIQKALKQRGCVLKQRSDFSDMSQILVLMHVHDCD
jgi:uncharacterized membrane protein